MLEDDQFRLWLSSESAIVPNSWTKAKSIMHNRNIVTRDTVEVHLSLVCGKTLHPFKSRHYSRLFSFQVVHLYETPLISVLACSFMCCLPPQRFLPTDSKRKCFSVMHSAAFWGCLILWARFPLGVCLAGDRWQWGSPAAGEQMTGSGCPVCSSMLQGSQTELLRASPSMAF